MIATDANFLEHPIVIDDTPANAGNSNADTAPITPGGLRVSVAERYDIIIDFNQYAAAPSFTSRKTVFQRDRRLASLTDPLPVGLRIEDVVMQFDVVAESHGSRKIHRPFRPLSVPIQRFPPVNNNWEWQFVPGECVFSGSRDLETHLDAYSIRTTRPTAFSEEPLKSGS